MYDSRYRPRRRGTNPVLAIVGLLILALVTGGIIVGGGALLSRSLLAIALPDPSGSPAPSASAGPDLVAAAAEPTRRPRPTVTPEATSAPSPLTPDPTGPATAEPVPTQTPRPWADLRPRPRQGAFAMDVYKAGAMASQLEAEWCVPAAMLTMINLVKKGRPDTSYGEMQRLYGLARRHSTDRLTGAGAEPEGWAEGLNREGIGPYIVHVAPTRAMAIKEAARALRFTGRPVGVLAWRGAHSWVMTGFSATADPARTNDFEVTDVVIADVWYPRVSTIWGASNPPGTSVPFERLPEDILPWRRPDVRYPVKDGKFVLVLPVREDGRYDPRDRT